MIFTQHPKHSEYFDMQSFIDDNLTTIRDIYDQVEKETRSGTLDLDIDEQNASVAIIISSVIYAEQDPITFPIPYPPEDKEGILELSHNLHIWVMLFSLEDRGLVYIKGDTVGLTEKGKRTSSNF